jgi:gamma-glutamylcyclotransferase (GGCT)/AIG2-like uncharacterized protein YtfP
MDHDESCGMDDQDLPLLGGRTNLDALLESINTARIKAVAFEPEDTPAAVAFDRLQAAASQRLAVYGTLAPGEVNERELASLRGAWVEGSVRGHLRTVGWGAAHGFPGLTLDPHAKSVRVQVFCSPELPESWARLDAFEGPEYVRLLVAVEAAGGGLLVSNLYALRPGP